MNQMMIGILTGLGFVIFAMFIIFFERRQH